MDEDEIQITDSELDQASSVPDVEAGAGDTAALGEDSASAAAPAWTPTREELQQLIGDTVGEQLGYLLQSAPQPQQDAGPGLDEIDLYDPETLAKYIDASNQRAVQAALEPLMPVIQKTQAEQQAEQAAEWLGTAKERVGGFEHEQSDMMAAYIAYGMLPQTVDPYRAPSGNPQQAVHQSAQMVHAYEEALMKKGEERYVARQKQLIQAQEDGATPTGSSSGSPATEIITRTTGDDELAFARKLVERNQLGRAS